MNLNHDSSVINPYSAEAQAALAAEAGTDARAEFLKRTYLHLAGAVIVFVGLEAFLMSLPGIESVAATMVSGWNWLLVLGVFMLASWGAERMARSASSLGMQYAGLALFVAVEAVIFVPLIYFALQMQQRLGQPIIASAAIGTIGLFTALSAVVFLTRKDFSFLRGALYMGGLIAMGLIGCSIIFGFQLGIFFTVAMIGFASLWVLYDTSNVLHHYRTDQHVSASLALFASLALLFWYILRLVMYLYAFTQE